MQLTENRYGICRQSYSISLFGFKISNYFHVCCKPDCISWTYLNERTALEAQKRNRIHIRTIFTKRSAKHQIVLILYGNSY